MGPVSAATTIHQLLSKPCTDFLPSPLDDGGKGDSWCVFWLSIPVAAPQGSMGVSHVWHSPGPAWAARAGEEDDGGRSRNQASPCSQAGSSTSTGDSVAFPTVGGFTGSWSSPEILLTVCVEETEGIDTRFPQSPWMCLHFHVCLDNALKLLYWVV